MVSAILDRFGRPMTADKKILTQEVARPGMTGVRQAWDPTTAVAGLTPDRLDAILRQANQGDMDAFLTLAEEMEERDPHYGSVLQTRKLAVLGLERKVTWAKGKEDDPRAAEIQDACEELLAAPQMEDLQTHLLDAIAKGYAAPQIMWATGANLWAPVNYIWQDPRWFQWDRETGRELRRKALGEVDGVPLEPFKFAVHLAGRKSGLAARGGLARLVAFSFVCKLYGLKDWMAYAEIFGIPLRLGKYEAGASPDDVKVLKQAVFGLGSDAAAVIPASMTIEFPELGKATGGAELFSLLVGWIDNQVSKAVLGQTGTTDMQKGGGFAQSTVLNEVRGDLTKADARGLGSTITREIFHPFVAFNWGPDAPVPNAELVVEEPEDVEGLSKALERLVPLGLRVSQAEVRKKMKLSEPAEGEELFTPPARAATPAVDPAGDPAEGPPAGPAANPGENRQDPQTGASDPAKTPKTPALARTALEGQVAGREAADRQLDEVQLAALEDWEPTFGAEAAVVLELVRTAESFDQVLAGLDAMAADLAAAPAARSLARAMFQAHVIGEAQRRQDT